MYEAMVCRLFRHRYHITMAIDSTSILVYCVGTACSYFTLIFLDADVDFTMLLYRII